MKILFTFLMLCHCSFFNSQTSNYSIGEIHHLESAAMKEKRTLNIHLPLGFSKDSVYPVMYVLDGSAHEDFLHVVGLVQFFQLQMGMPDFILVGIENVDRKRDFTFHTDNTELQQSFPTAGHSDQFIQFLESELRPYIDQHFKTNGTNYLIGQSLGGLLASEVLLKKPHLFSHYLIVSPSLWWDETSLLRQAPSLAKSQTISPVHVCISVGDKEHPIMRRDARKLRKIWKKADKKGTFHYNKLKKENHATVLHNALYAAFLYLYPPLPE